MKQYHTFSYKSIPTLERDISSPFDGCRPLRFGLLELSQFSISASERISVPNNIFTVSWLGGTGTILFSPLLLDT